MSKNTIQYFLLFSPEDKVHMQMVQEQWILLSYDARTRDTGHGHDTGHGKIKKNRIREHGKQYFIIIYK